MLMITFLPTSSIKRKLASLELHQNIDTCFLFLQRNVFPGQEAVVNLKDRKDMSTNVLWLKKDKVKNMNIVHLLKTLEQEL
jgi:hypothetical protein